MANYHADKVIEHRKWAMQIAAAICRNVSVEALKATAEDIFTWAAVVPKAPAAPKAPNGK